ncbi:hypothetical protein TWF594_010778 [Orbilia oligospora]|uniref:Uncharacterized protein n=1 Tax=Orbilia oligospora TaxID=2813651 RepID=A0A7C8JR90_ORBOL|nr:hypothetical protein TWF706_009145 [Orbilia oligospora]KAF3115983.1 hypothetical protein TWF103_010209 [Orbilia oligospora]KAF3138196.1 hypothetical protein TWF703_004725 [Orbilia oligospora]KAF3149679.1 hypothetical protein TWF594_010778 [Orbilia oligospora]
MDASERERFFAPYLTPIFKANWARELRAAPAIVEILAIWNAYALRDDVIAIELEPTHTRVNQDAPGKGLLATLISLSHRGRRAFQQAQTDGEAFLQVVNELSKMESYVLKLVGGSGVESVLGGGTLSAFEDLACEIETGIEAVARTLEFQLARMESSPSQRIYRVEGEKGTQNGADLLNRKTKQRNTLKDILKELISLQSNVCTLTSFFKSLYLNATELSIKYEADIKIATEDDTIAMLSTEAADSIHRELAISRMPVATKLKVYVYISHIHIIPGLEMIEAFTMLDSRNAGLNEQIESGLEQMAKYRCDAQEAIDEVITDQKLQLWDQLKATGYNLSDGSSLNPRRRAATTNALETIQEEYSGTSNPNDKIRSDLDPLAIAVFSAMFNSMESYPDKNEKK